MENEWGAQLTAQAGLSTHAYALPISDPLKVHDLVVSHQQLRNMDLHPVLTHVFSELIH